MASSVLELLRLNHESSEKHEIAIGKEMDTKPNGQKAKVLHQHRLKRLASEMSDINRDLLRLYGDKDGLMKEEVESMRGTEMFENFYNKLTSTKEYYQKFPSTLIDLNEEITCDVEIPFSGEEVFGKYLDLNNIFAVFLNIMKDILKEQDYLQYLDRFNSFFYIPIKVKSTKQYLDYLEQLWKYLKDFFDRTSPLVNLDSIINNEWKKDFESSYVPDQQAIENKITSNVNAAPQPLRLGMFADPSELEALGMNRLKEALEAIGLKCGGTLQDRAQRLWSIRGKKPEDYPANLRAKPVNKKRKTESDDLGHHKNVAWLEFKIAAICECMADIVGATRRHAEKQQSRSLAEKEAEIFEEEFGLLPDVTDKDGDDDDDEAPIYNPRNVPLGWDGKPIPYWLYKLHGLGEEFKCEICGNQSYWGRRAFDKHFQEWKHAHGMRCLGIPNTKHFHDITLIEDALTLYKKIKDTINRDQFNVETEEEFEDTQGNILNRRTYEDLARQGLL